MEDFCPLCANKGRRSRMKAFQINMEEAVWSCELEECVWPFGFEPLKFFARPAMACLDEEPSPAENDGTSRLIELSLYTPPVTPGQELSKELTEIASTEYSPNPSAEVGTWLKCEFNTSTRESPGQYKSLFEPLELGGVHSTERNVRFTNEQIAGVNVNKILPRVTSIEKTNINIKIHPKTEYCDIRKVQQQPLMNTIVNALPETMQRFNLSDSALMEFDLSTQYESTQDESGKLQSDATVGGVETSFALSKSMGTLVEEDLNNSNETNKSIAVMSLGEIDTLLEDLINSESHIPSALSDDWLNSLMS